MKLILTQLLAALTGVVIVCAAPPTSTNTAAPPAARPADDAARKLLDAQYATEGAAPSGATPAPGRTLPGQLTATPVSPAGSPAPAPAGAPAPAQPAPPSATFPATSTNAVKPPTNITASATNAAATTNRPFRFTPVPPPGFNTAQPATTNTTAIPVGPNAGQARPAGTPPGPGQVQPGTATAAGAATGAAGAAVPDENELLPSGFIKFQDAAIEPVLEIYQDLTGRTVLKPASLPQVKISIRFQNPLTRKEAVEALDSILSLNQISMVPQGDKFVKALAAPDAGTAGQRFYTGGITNLPEAGVYITYTIQLKNAQPNDLVPVLQPFSKAPNSILTIPSTSMLILRDYAENVKRMVEIIEKIDVVPQQNFESVVIPIKYAMASDISQVLGSLTAGGSTTTVGGQGGGGGGLSGGRGLSGSGMGGGMGGMGGMGSSGYGGQPGYNPGGGQYGRYQVGTATPVGAAGGARGSFQQRLQNIVNRATTPGGGQDEIFVLGQTKIIADERINALLIFASKTDLVTISNIIEKVDVVLPQVLIEAVILEVNLNNNLNYGFSYIQNEPSHIGDWFTGIGAIRTIPFLRVGEFGSNSVGDGFTYAARIFDMDAAITAVAGDGRGKILQRPRIQTSHAREAKLFVGQSRPYPTTSYYGGGAFGGYSSIQQLRIGVNLSVLPLVNADGLVVMEISQSVESYDGDVTIQNVGDVPITSQKEANAYVAVRDGETIMLGGFISNEKSKSHGGVPILKDIPLLGVLFRSNKESDSRRELMVMIRPTVLPTPESAATFASEERQNMPGTKEAEQDFRRSEQKLLEDTNRRMERNSTKDTRRKY